MGLSVEVVLDPTRAKGEADEPPLACAVGKDFSKVLVPSIQQFRPGSVFHELQHIRRFLVEGAPRLVDC